MMILYLPMERREFLMSAGAAGLQVGEAAQIWDLHCHITSAQGSTPEERTAYLLEFADRLGINRLMLSLGYPLLDNPPPEQLREENDQVLRAIRRWPDR